MKKAGAALGVLLFYAVPVRGAVTQPITQGDIFITLKSIAVSNFNVLDLAHAGDGANRLFVASQGGNVRLIKNNALQTTPFLSVQSALGATVFPGGSGEKGLLGVAFHPNFNAPAGSAGSGKFYTYTSETYTAQTPPHFTHPEIGSGGDHQSVIREWSVSASNPDLIDTSIPSRVLMRIAQPQANHNGGAIKFGKDGFLHVAMGDGGGGGDAQPPEPDGHTNGLGNGQDTSNVYGDILRIDPVHPSLSPPTIGAVSGNGQYRVPSDNPYVSAPGPQPNSVPEIYAYGFRNPFRMGFDRKTGKLYVGDVGQSAREEVNIVQKGGNFGWVTYEGSAPAGSGTISPVAEYDNNTDGRAIIGGFVYRGFRIPDLHGKYVFGDYIGNQNRGRIFHTGSDGGTIFEMRYNPGTPTIASLLYGFGEGPTGELYALFSNGAVMQIAGGPPQWEKDGSGNWNTGANWTNNAIPNGVGAVANLMGGLITPNNSNAVVTLDSTVTLGTLKFFNDALPNNPASPYTFTIQPVSDGTVINLDNTGSADARVIVDAGHHRINARLTFTDSTTFDVAANSSLTLGPLWETPALKVLRKLGPGHLEFTQRLYLQTFAGLEVQDGTVYAPEIHGTGNITATNGGMIETGAILSAINVNVGAGGTIKLNPGTPVFGVSRTSNFLLAGGATPTGTLDVNHRFIIGSEDLPTLEAQVRHAWNSGAWDRNGITSMLARDSGGTKMVAATRMPNGEGFLDVTWFGDTDVDGDIDADDYRRADRGYLLRLSGWLNGDNDYSGLTDLDDFLRMDAAFHAQFAAATAVPECSVVGMLAALSQGILCRRRRRVHAH